MSKTNNWWKRRKKAIVIGAVIVSSAASVAFVEDYYFEVSKNLDIYTTLFRDVNMYYVDSVQPGALMKKGIDAMLGSLDPYTIIIPESDIEDYRKIGRAHVLTRVTIRTRIHSFA